MRIDVSQAMLLDSSKLDVKKFSGDELAAFKRELLETGAQKYQKAIVPEDKAYATVVDVHGRTIATLSNNGYVTCANAWGGRVQSVLGNENLQGPQLAAERAAAIAQAFHGRVEMADTALTQGEWKALPDIRWTIDTEQMIADGYLDAARYSGQSFQSAKLATAVTAALLEMQEREPAVREA